MQTKTVESADVAICFVVGNGWILAALSDALQQQTAMSEAVLAAAVQETISSMGKVIRRPPMTEKLLVKPPFRFLHDVVSELIKTTGFLDGLFTANEMVCMCIWLSPTNDHRTPTISPTSMLKWIFSRRRLMRPVRGSRPAWLSVTDPFPSVCDRHHNPC